MTIPFVGRINPGCPSRFWTFLTRQTQLVPTVLRGNALPDAPASAADRQGHGPRRRGASRTAFPRRTVGTRLDIDQLTPKSRGALDRAQVRSPGRLTPGTALASMPR